MKKIVAMLLIASLCVFAFAACSKDSAAISDTGLKTTASVTAAKNVEIHISAAASLTEALNKISELYKSGKPNVTLTFNFGASGTLQTQIEQGAPADIFISAAQKQMDTLASEDLILKDTRKDLLINKVVLIVPKSSAAAITGFSDCLTDKVKMVAVGDPASVPVGQYTQQIFTYLNGWDAVKAKANLGSDVKQVLSWTASGDVDCGIVYATDAATSSDVKVIAEAPEGSCSPVVYPEALVKSTAIQKDAQDLLDFLSTDKAKQVFIDQGFTMA